MPERPNRTEIEIEDNPSFDNGVTYAIELLADMIGVTDWQIREGSEDYEADVCMTIQGVLQHGRIYDEETGRFARLGPALLIVRGR
jgi:hypothetical protein